MAATVVAALTAVVVLVDQDSQHSTLDAGPTVPAATEASPSPSPTPSVTGTPSPTPDPTPQPSPAASPVLAVLDQLPVKGRAPKTGYDREQFGSAWADVDGNGCDTRNDVLARDLTEVIRDADGCTVRSGLLADPYSRVWIRFVRGQGTSEAVQVDHVVALADAWQKGAQQLSPAERERFANDPLNLLAVDGALNQQKSDGDAATWLPPNRGFWCAFVARQVAVKARYGLWVTQAEKDAITRVLGSCPNQPLPPAAARAGVVPDGPPPAPADYAPAFGPGVPSSGELVFATCTQARDAGAAPLRRGEPGYRAALDRDGDGLACE
jgi:hypothetical protein